MEIIFGALCGLLFGVITSFLPAANVVSFVFLAAGSMSPLFLVSFTICQEAISGVLKSLHLLNPVLIGMDQNTYLAEEGQLPKLLEEGKGLAAVKTSMYVSFVVKAMICAVGILLIVTGKSSIFKISLSYQSVAIVIAAVTWIKIALKAENKLIAIGAMLASVVIGFCSTKLPGQNNMMAVAFAFVGIPVSASLLKEQRQTLPDQNPDLKGSEEIPFLFVIPGLLSNLLMGLPCSALLSAFKDDENTGEFLAIAKSCTAEASASAIGLVMALCNAGSRSASATYLQNAMSFNPIFCVGLLLATILISYFAWEYAEGFIKLYLELINLIKPRVFGVLVLAASTVVTVTCLGFWMGGILIIAGLMINSWVEKSGCSQCATLIGMSSIPLLGMMGF